MFEKSLCVFRPAVSQHYNPAGNVSGPHPSYPQHYGPPPTMQQVTNQMTGMQINSGPPTPAGPGYGKCEWISTKVTHYIYMHTDVPVFCPYSEKSSVPIKFFPWLLKINNVLLFLFTCSDVKPSIQRNFLPLLLLFCKTAVKLLPLCFQLLHYNLHLKTGHTSLPLERHLALYAVTPQFSSQNMLFS